MTKEVFAQADAINTEWDKLYKLWYDLEIEKVSAGTTEERITSIVQFQTELNYRIDDLNKQFEAL